MVVTHVAHDLFWSLPGNERPSWLDATSSPASDKRVPHNLWWVPVNETGTENGPLTDIGFSIGLT